MLSESYLNISCLEIIKPFYVIFQWLYCFDFHIQAGYQHELLCVQGRRVVEVASLFQHGEYFSVQSIAQTFTFTLHCFFVLSQMSLCVHVCLYCFSPDASVLFAILRLHFYFHNLVLYLGVRVRRFCPINSQESEFVCLLLFYGIIILQSHFRASSLSSLKTKQNRTVQVFF